MPAAVIAGCFHQALDLVFRQMLARAQLGVLYPTRHNCSFYTRWRDQSELHICHGKPRLLYPHCWYNGPAPSLLQLLGAGGLVLVVLTHVSEALHLFPWMHWRDEHSIGHYLD